MGDESAVKPAGAADILTGLHTTIVLELPTPRNTPCARSRSYIFRCVIGYLGYSLIGGNLCCDTNRAISDDALGAKIADT